jgi:hypothetical protein
MGRYCKAYQIHRFKDFNGWPSDLRILTKEKQEIDGAEVEVERALGDDDHLYLQENMVVTKGIFIDEDIVFDDVSPEWQEFCKARLRFEVPDYSKAQAATTGEKANQSADEPQA